jgi:HK97 family phage major capsid protein
VDLTHQLLEDSSMNLEAIVREEMLEQFNLAEGTAFVSGDGNGRPFGFTTNAAMQTAAVANGHATVLQADGLFDLFYDLIPDYARNGNWCMARGSILVVRKLKDGNSQYIWQPGLQAGEPANLLGRPIVEATDMPAIASAAYPIAFGDFRRNYLIVDRVGIRSLRIEDSARAAAGTVRIHAYRRVGGQVIVVEAVRLLVMST